MHMVRKTKLTKDMGAEIFENMRAGDWLLDYTVHRIRDYARAEPSVGLHNLAEFLSEYVEAVKQLPAHLKPKYGSKVIEVVYYRTVQEILSKRVLDDFMRESDDPFVQRLALAVYQMYGRVPSVYFKDHKDSMCAGLAHFSTGYMRCWGRDTFIALRGLLIVTGLEEEARDTILFFAKVSTAKVLLLLLRMALRLLMGGFFLGLEALKLAIGHFKGLLGALVKALSQSRIQLIDRQDQYERKTGQ